MYNIPNLTAGVLYYVRVSAVSSVGTSDSTPAANNPVAPSQHPDAPADIAAEAIIGGTGEINSEIEVRLQKCISFVSLSPSPRSAPFRVVDAWQGRPECKKKQSQSHRKATSSPLSCNACNACCSVAGLVDIAGGERRV